jgi:hypothetical protein
MSINVSHLVYLHYPKQNEGEYVLDDPLQRLSQYDRQSAHEVILHWHHLIETKRGW